jgi:hypothetical protein
MAHTAAPSASEKEKTARLVASLSCKEQAELLAQALLREFMHRRGLHETLKAFDQENPRDERTISSRALMRQLLNIPVADRPSRLQPTACAANGKPLPPTFMEELCSYRLTKRQYTHPTIKLGDERPDDEEDPSDVELRTLHDTVDAHRTAKAACEQKQRRYEEMLAEEENYQRRKGAHKSKKKKRESKARRSSKDKHRHSRDEEGEDDEEEEDSDADSGDDDEDLEDSEGSSGQFAGVLGRRLSGALALTPKGTAKRRVSDDTSLIGAGGGTGWQPPGLRTNGAPTDAGDGGTSHHHHHHHFQPSASHSVAWTPAAATVSHNEDNKDDDHDDDNFDPFGSGASSQQALMARVRAESRRWGSGRGTPGETSNLTTPKKGVGAGDGGRGDAIAGQPSPLAALSNVPRGLALGSGNEAGGATGGADGSLSLRLGSGSGLGGGLGALGTLGGNTRVSAAPAGYNPNAVTALSGVAGASHQPTSEADAAAVAADGPVVTPYSHGFPPPPSSALAPSIMVKHTDAAARRDTVTPSQGPTPTFDLKGTGTRVAGGATADGGGGAHSYDRAAVPRSGAMAGSGSGSSLGRGWATQASAIEVRSPSPTVSAAGDDGAALALQTPVRSANNSGSGGNSGLRHGIGFRTSVSAEGTHSSTGASAVEGEGARHNRKERRVKLLIDD